MTSSKFIICKCLARQSCPVARRNSATVFNLGQSECQKVVDHFAAKRYQGAPRGGIYTLHPQYSCSTIKLYKMKILK